MAAPLRNTLPLTRLRRRQDAQPPMLDCSPRPDSDITGATHRDHTDRDTRASLRFLLAFIVMSSHVATYVANADPVTKGVGHLGGKAAARAVPRRVTSL